MASCPPNKTLYLRHGILSTFVQSIPFIGPAIDSTSIPHPPNKEDDLVKAQANLTASVNNWQSAITTEVVKIDQDLNNLIKTIIGTGNNDDYAYITSQYVLQPTAEKVTINTINITFLGILLSLVLFYLLMNKKVV